MKSKDGVIYVLVCMGPEGLGGDMGEYLITSCTNLYVLSKLSGIKYDRLAYLFSRLKKVVVIEGDNMIIKVKSIYVGRQEGGKRGKDYSGFNR